MGVNEIYNMQSYRSGFLNFLENIFSLFGNTIIVVLILAAYVFFVKERVKTVVHVIFLTGVLYYMTILKQIFEESRPFWTTSQIKHLEWLCPLSFGNPSGHSFVVIVLYEPIISDVLGTGPKKVGIFVWLFLSALVMMSRMYLGAHSLDQIVFGGMLGLCFLVYYKFFLQELLYRTIINILNNRHKQFYFMANTVIAIIFLTLPIIVYVISLQNRAPVEAILLSNIEVGCGKVLTSNYLLSKNLMGNVLGFIAVGMFYGLLMLSNEHNQDVLYLTGRWHFREGKYAFYLFLALLVVAGVPGAILGIVLPLLISSAVVGFICLTLAATWGSFVLVYVLTKIQNKYRWISYES